MKLLNPGYPPLHQPGLSSWTQDFVALASKSSELILLTAYASEDSLLALTDFVKQRAHSMPKIARFDFILGLAYFEGLTERQIVALSKLESLLVSVNLGHVRVSEAIGIHSKCSIYKIDGSWHGILGSTNFSAFVPQRKAETDIYLEPNNKATKDLVSFMEIVHRETSPLTKSIVSQIPVIKRKNNQLAQSALVQTASIPIAGTLNGATTFDIPIKTEERSNLNKFNAKPRGTVARSWWEVEFIIPTTIQRSTNFPNKVDGTNVFQVVTDDGYSFTCHVSGGEKPRSNKNFESNNDLKVLGYWIKGKLLEAGVISEGDMVTDEVLKNYGRDHVRLTQIGSNTWFLDFERP